MTTRRIILTAAPILAALTGIRTAMAAAHPVRIAFVDTGNTGRSVAAETLAAAVIGKNHLNAQVISRAVNWNPYNTHPEDNFVTLFRQRGIDVSRHVAAQFGAQEAKFSDVILTMTEAHKTWVIGQFPDAKEKVFTLAEYATGKPGEILDAFGQPMDFYKKVLAQLDSLVGPAVMKAAKP
jgi:protein-tyrosine phosphatase